MEPLKVLIFRVGDRYFAIASKNAKEIVDSSENLKTVFYGGRALKGLMNFEGDVVSVLNGPFILGIEDDGKDHVILLCKEKEMERAVGITISEVKGMEVIDASKIAPLLEKDAAYISGFVRQEDKGKEKIVTLIDMEKFFDYAYSKIERL